MSALSEIIGPPLAEEPELGALTLAGFLTEVCERHADREALCWRDQSGVDHRWTYAELQRESEQVARSLLALGAAKDSRVGILISNRPEWLFTMFGAAMAGAVGVALNTFSTQQELAYQLQLADVEFLLMENGVASNDFVANMAALCPALCNTVAGKLHDESFPFLRHVVCLDDSDKLQGALSWREFITEGDSIASALVAARATTVSPADRGLIFFSSGTTALPKGIQQTQRAAVLQCWRFGRFYETDSSVRSWSANGFFWSGNFAMALGGTMSVGGCMVLQGYFDPDASLALLQREKVSMPIAWPHQEARLLECPGWEDADLSAMHFVDAESVLTSHPTTNTDWRQPNGYGMTETFTFISGIAGSERDTSDKSKDSQGDILAGNTVRIIDPLSGELLPMGESGEIIVKGPTLTPGYLKVPPEDTFDADGFIHTGDKGYLTAEGRLFWLGRLSDIIKTGGANVSPAEIDAVIAGHDAVQSSFTVGVPHDTLGELVVACVVLGEGKQADEATLRAFMRESLAAYKVPRQVLFFAEEELPMTGSNKVRRGELVDIAAARLADTASS